jgi:hypothetical protein
MTQRNRMTSAATLALGTILLTGCSTKIDELNIQSKFSYPNGDYAAVGHAHSEVSSTSVFNTPEMTREVFQELQQQALAQNGGADDLIDYIVSAKTTNIFIVNTTTFSLDGTAIKVKNLDGQLYQNGAPILSPTRSKKS